MKISAGLGGSKLEARGGIIGGSIELQQLDSEGVIYTCQSITQSDFIYLSK